MAFSNGMGMLVVLAAMQASGEVEPALQFFFSSRTAPKSCLRSLKHQS